MQARPPTASPLKVEGELPGWGLIDHRPRAQTSPPSLDGIFKSLKPPQFYFPSPKIATVEMKEQF